MDQSIMVDKTKLIEKLKANLESHRETFETAQRVYKEKIIEALEKQLELARRKEPVDRHVLSRMPVPEDHTKDYEIAIEMLELETRDEVELTTYDFTRYWRDEWEWQQSWAANTVAYSMQA